MRITPKKIVYFADPNSIHDIKWISYFSEKESEYICYIQCDTNCKIDEKTKLELAAKNIQLLPTISPFSISRPIKTIGSILKLKKTIGDVNPDFVHVLFTSPNAIWLNFLKSKSILTMRGSDILIVIPNLLQQKGAKKIYFRFLYKMFSKAYNRALMVTGTSQAQLDKAKRLFKLENVALIRTGVDVDKIEAINNDDLIPEVLRGKPFVLSPRFMSPIYNISLQIEALKVLDNKIIDNHTFVFIRGKIYDEVYYERQKEKLEALRNTYHLKFVILEYVDQETIWMLMKRAALCIMTPISDGTPNSALEAMAAKCPLIISDLEQYEELLFNPKSVKMVPLAQPETLAKIIKDVLNSDNLEQKKFAFEIVSKHGNRSEEMEKLKRLYDKY
jgi:glycosyltransferase involved in cell wall biosynthesis